MVLRATTKDENKSAPTTGFLSRRAFLGRVGTSTAVVAAGASLPSLLAPLSKEGWPKARRSGTGPQNTRGG